MALDQFLIAPMTEGLRTDVEPWLIPEEAFARLQNAYVWRGRLRKRFGSTFIPTTTLGVGYEQLASRLRVKLGTTDGAGDLAGNVLGATFKVGQMFSIGTDLFTVVALGTPGVMITNSATATVMTFDTTTGAYDIQTSNALTDCYFYPAESVMGFANYEITSPTATINNEPSYAFDTQFAYTFVAGGWERLGTATWTSTDYQFFWAENHYRALSDLKSLLFVTNNNTTDHVCYWDGATWTTLHPQYTAVAGDTIEACRIIISFKDRLLFLNTYERVDATGVTSNHPNRCRYSQKLDPTNPATSWIPASGGGGVDAPTKEVIVSARKFKDRLIVFFEKSTWELDYSGNPDLPFIWRRINTELGAESTFASVPFDKVLLGVGNVGIHSCNGFDVERIDEKIPQAIFNIHNGNQGVDRVHGIRDYFAETVYWTIPDHVNNPTYPTKIVVYNYRTKTWARNDDCITCFGYIQNLSDLTWALSTDLWQNNLEIWDTGRYQSQYRQIIAGNQEGFTFLVDINEPRNAPALQITNLVNAAGVVTVTVIDHNLQPGDYVLIESVQGATNVSGVYEILANPAPTTSTFAINEPLFGGVYTGGGTITRVSKIDVITKQYNFYQKECKNLFVPKVSFYVGSTENGQISVDFAASSSDTSLVDAGSVSGSLLGTSILETTPYNTVTFEQTQDRFWHTLYPQAEGEVVQMRFYLSDDQLLDENIALSDFQLNAVAIYARRVNRE